jgi:thiol-disulfide isomerase/thioredoxin
VAIEKVTPERLRGGPITLTMQPECRVSGRLTCPALERRKIALGFTNVETGPVRYCSEDQTFELFLPPGTYTLGAHGDKVHSVEKTITVKPEQRELKLDSIEFTLPRRLALLEGTPAPEFTELVAWKNSPQLKLADLRGKCIVVEFWGSWCQPCLRDMPALFKLYDRYHAEGLEIIGVHVDKDGTADTVAKMDEALTAARAKLWKGRDIPFPVALARHQEVKYGSAIHQRAPCQIAADFGITFYPTSVLIDRNGKVVGRFLPETEAGLALLKKTLKEN